MGTLSTDKINYWLDKDLPDRLIITPLLDREEQIRDNSVHLRLGNEFIITKRTSFPYIDVANKNEIEKEIEQYQERIIIRFNKPFVLHPN